MDKDQIREMAQKVEEIHPAIWESEAKKAAIQHEADAALGRALREAIPALTEDMIPGLVGLFEVFKGRDITFGTAIALIGQGQKWEGLREKWPGVTEDDLAGVIRCVEGGILPSSNRLARLRGERERQEFP